MAQSAYVVPRLDSLAHQTGHDAEHESDYAGTSGQVAREHSARSPVLLLALSIVEHQPDLPTARLHLNRDHVPPHC